ncbi:MAG: hypothetical protein BWY85_00721 [Firmicutes bacterium ADurb.Bin506]|nr:MAG: hypothetical protein BWY85_00721 [Firmicutes bacterium ADurb.Bin506]
MRRDAFTLADEPQQQVVGVNITVAHAARLFDGQLKHALDARAEADGAAGDLGIALSYDRFDLFSDGISLDAEGSKGSGRNAMSFTGQAEQEVLSPEHIVAQLSGFLL